MAITPFVLFGILGGILAGIIAGVLAGSLRVCRAAVLAFGLAGGIQFAAWAFWPVGVGAWGFAIGVAFWYAREAGISHRRLLVMSVVTLALVCLMLILNDVIWTIVWRGYSLSLNNVDWAYSWREVTGRAMPIIGVLIACGCGSYGTWFLLKILVKGRASN